MRRSASGPRNSVARNSCARIKVAICEQMESQRGHQAGAPRSHAVLTPGEAIDSAWAREENNFPGGVGTSFVRGRIGGA